MTRGVCRWKRVDHRRALWGPAPFRFCSRRRDVATFAAEDYAPYRVLLDHASQPLVNERNITQERERDEEQTRSHDRGRSR